MNILFLSRHENLHKCQYYSKYFSNFGNKCIIFESQEDFFRDVRYAENETDLYIIDYNHFNHIILNLYNYLLNSYNCHTPLIFFDDPCLETNQKVSYWKNILKMVYGNRITDIRKYEFILSLLDNAITDYAGKDTQDTRKDVIKEVHAVSDCMEEKVFFHTKIACNLSASAYIIYEELSRRTGNYIKVEELVNTIRKNDKIPKETTVVCLVSEIRKALRNSEYRNLDIIKIADGYRLVNKK